MFPVISSLKGMLIVLLVSCVLFAPSARDTHMAGVWVEVPYQIFYYTPNRKHILREGTPNIGDSVGFGKPITGIYFGSAR